MSYFLKNTTSLLFHSAISEVKFNFTMLKEITE